MRKTICMILGVMLLLNVIAIVGIADGGEKTIKVYGTIEMDGEPVEDADINVKNLDEGHEEDTTTDEDGYYEVYINGKNHDDVEVNVDFDDVDDDRQFEIYDGQNNYEMNFDFESSSVRRTYRHITGFVSGIHWGFWEWLVFILIVLVILYLIKKTFFNGHYYYRNNNGYRYRR